MADGVDKSDKIVACIKIRSLKLYLPSKGSRIVDGEIDYLFFFTDPMTLQPHDTDVKALTRLAGVENIVFCCNRSTADHIISSPLFVDPEYQRTRPDYSTYAKRFENKPLVTEAVENVEKRKVSKGH